MTEEEAKTKWCFHFTASHTNPRQREWLDSDDALNGEPTGHFAHHCIGSACMAWRPKRDFGDAGSVITTGYCGLAGAPQ